MLRFTMEITVFEDQFLGNSDSVKHKRIQNVERGF